MNSTINNKEKYKLGIIVFIRYLKKFKKPLIGVCIFSLLTALLAVFVPYLSGALLDSIILASGGEVKQSLIIRFLEGSFSIIFTIWILFGFLDVLFSRLGGQLTRRMEIMLENEYYTDFVDKLLHLPMSFHTSRKLGELMQNLSKGASWLSNLVDELFHSIMPALLSMIGGIVIAFLLSPVLGLTLLIGGIIFVVSIFPLVKNSEGLQDNTWKEYSVAYEVAYESIDHVKEVKQAGRENEEISKAKKQFKDVAAPLWIRLTEFWQNLSLFQRIIVICIQGVLFILGFRLVIAGSLSIGELAALNGYAGLILGPFVTIGRSWQRMQSAVTYLARNEDIYTIVEEPYRPEKILEPDFSKGVSFEDVYFSYSTGDKDVLQGMTFQVSTGTTTALVGRSGEGKSTIVDLIGGFYLPVQGEVKVGGVSTRNLALKDLRRQIAYVPQEIYLFNTTLRENVAYGTDAASDEKIEAALAESGLAEFVQALPNGLNTVVGERGIKLSVGQKQRVAIARAMLRNPQILILDEPTSALDIETERFVTASLEKLMKDRITFIIAHRLSTVRKADTILVIEEGKVAESGKHQDLILKEDSIYKKLHDMHLGLYESV